MIYITRNYKLNLYSKNAFEIYSDSTCENLQFSCDYYEMIETLQNSLDEMVDNGLITHEQAWNMREDYIAYNEIVETYAE